MDAARCLTAGEEAGNDLTLGADDLGLGVDLDTAHRVVDARGDLDRIERGNGEILVHALAAEFLILALGDGGVPGLHGLHKVLRGLIVHPHGLGELLIGLTCHGIAAGDKLLRQRNLVHQLLIEDDEGIGAGLLQLSLGDHIAPVHIVDKTLALGVHQDGTVAAERLRNQQAVGLDHGRVELNLLHIDGGSADRLSHQDTVAGRAGMVGGDRVGKARIKARHQFKVCTEAAGRKHDRLGLHGVEMLGILGLHADNLAILHQDLGRAGVEHHVHTQLLDLVLELIDEVLADRETALRLMQVLAALGTAGGLNLRQRSADGIQPVNGFGAVLGKGANQIGIGQVVAETERILNVVFHGAVGQAERFLILGIGSVHAALGAQAVAAHHGHFLQDEDIGPLLGGAHRSRQTGAAGTDDQHVTLKLNLGLLRRGLLSRFRCGGGEVCGIDAGLGQGRGNGGLDRVGGHGRTGDTVDLHTLGGDDLRGQLLHGHGADALGLVVLGDFNGVDAAFVRDDLNHHVLTEDAGRLRRQGLGPFRRGRRSLFRRRGFLSGFSSFLCSLSFRRWLFRSQETGLGQRLGHSGLDGVGGHRRTGDAVDLDALRFDDLAGQLVHSHGADALGLVVLHNGHRIDLIGVGHDLNHHVLAEHAGLGNGIGLGTLGDLHRGRSGLFRSLLDHFFHLGLRRGFHKAGLDQGLGHSALDGVGGHRRPGDAIHLNTLRLDDLAGQLLRRNAAEFRRLAMLHDLDGIDAVRIRHSLHLHFAEDALRRRRIGLCRIGNLGTVSLRVQVAQYNIRDQRDDQEQAAEDPNGIQLLVLHAPSSTSYLGNGYILF